MSYEIIEEKNIAKTRKKFYWDRTVIKTFLIIILACICIIKIEKLLPLLIEYLRRSSRW